MPDESRRSDGHDTPRFYSVEEAAEILHVSKMTLYRALAANAFPAIRIRSRYAVPAKAIDEMERVALETRSVVDAADWVATASR
jgi:excisionase family DNA binding protein